MLNKYIHKLIIIYYIIKLDVKCILDYHTNIIK